MTMQGQVTAVGEVSGPLVKGDPAKVMLATMEALHEDIAREGAATARSRFLSGAAGRAPVRVLGDRVGDHIVGRTMGRPSKGGRRWHVWGVVQVYNEGFSVAGGRSLMAAASVLEGRLNVMRTIARQLAQRLRSIDLTKGLE